MIVEEEFADIKQFRYGLSICSCSGTRIRFLAPTNLPSLSPSSIEQLLLFVPQKSVWTEELPCFDPTLRLLLSAWQLSRLVMAGCLLTLSFSENHSAVSDAELEKVR